MIRSALVLLAGVILSTAVGCGQERSATPKGSSATTTANTEDKNSPATTTVTSKSDSSSGLKTSTHQLKVAAASDLRFAFKDLEAEFERQSSAIDVESTFGSSGNFFAQIAGEAPFDLFLSANVEYPQRLIDEGHAVEGSLFRYAIGYLVAFVPNEKEIDFAAKGLEILTDPSIKQIALANPAHAPYGKAAMEALTHYGIADKLAGKLRLADNVSQAAQFVESGGADVGLISKSIAMVQPLAAQGTWWEVPQEAYTPLVQAGVVPKSAAQPQSATEFREFLLSEAGQEIFARYGFSPPGE